MSNTYQLNLLIIEFVFVFSLFEVYNNNKEPFEGFTCFRWQIYMVNKSPSNLNIQYQNSSELIYNLYKLYNITYIFVLICFVNIMILNIVSFERDWLRRDLNVIGFGLIGWLAPSSIPAINGDSLTGLFFGSIGTELAHFPTPPALTSPFWLV